MNLGQLGWDYLQQVFGDELHLRLSFSERFLMTISGNNVVAAFHRVAGIIGTGKKSAETPSGRYSLSGRRHFPFTCFTSRSVGFYGASLLVRGRGGIPNYSVVLPATLLSVFRLSMFTEQKKHVWKIWIERLLVQLTELASNRFRQSFAR
ncbi:MAG: hypothetical protein R3E50_13750 [Halioglobus sp.]